MSTPSRGRIVWAEFPDPQGRNPKCRPAVIISSDDEIQTGADVWVVAITTRVDQAPDVEVALPWHAQGHPRTGLNERCVAVCSWRVRIPVTSIQGYAGVVPGKQLLQILGLVGPLPASP